MASGCGEHDTQGGFCPVHQSSNMTSDSDKMINREPSKTFAPLISNLKLIIVPDMRKYRNCQNCKAEWPIYGYEDKHPTHCKSCKQSGMRNVMKHGRGSICHGDPETGDPCNTRAHYGTEGSYTHCSPHYKKLEAMKNSGKYTSSKYNEKGFPLCRENGCQYEWPTYGYEDKKPTHCETCKKTGMENVVHKMCHGDPKNGKVCLVTRASYGDPNNPEKQPTHCSQCGEKHGMENIRHRKCSYVDPKTNERCKTMPCYNFPGETRGIVCESHIEVGMEDVIHSKCPYIDPETKEPCGKQVCYGFPNGSPTHCSPHGKTIKGMINVRSPRCSCGTIANYGLKGQSIVTHCGPCGSVNGMVNLRTPRCSSCKAQINSKSREKFKGYCFQCYRIEYPNDLPVYNYNTKARAVIDFLSKALPFLTLICDKSITGCLYQYRPDILINYEKFVIIIEIDEHQHRYYDPIEEIQRMRDIATSLNCEAVIFIRFNPDSYIQNATRFPSCWKSDINGKMKIDNETAWNERLTTLLKLLQKYLIDGVTGHICEYLYYDDFMEDDDI